MGDRKDGGPAFPEVRIRSGDNYNPPTKLYYRGMTLRDYAAIKLKVPNSGTEWLDDMIRESLRDELAAKAMQGLTAAAFNYMKGEGHATEAALMMMKDIGAVSYDIADALLSQRADKEG